MSLFLNLTVLFLITGFLFISGCASKGDDFYKHQPTSQPLEVPPDLTIPEANSGFEIPAINSVETKKIKLEDNGSVVLKKDGRLRWLEITAPPELVWNNTKDFWITRNVELKWQNLKLGILETDWVKHYDNDFEKDRFRVRVEPGTQSGTSLLFLTHRGSQEVLVDGQVVSGWAKTFSDPELEIEILGELLGYFGLASERKSALLDEAKQKSDDAVLMVNTDIPHIAMSESTVRSWRFVMQAIDRMGHTVVDRDKKAHWLDVRIESDETSDFTPGFALSDADRELFRVQIETKNERTKITVLNDQGQLDRSESAKTFLSDLYDYIK